MAEDMGPLMRLEIWENWRVLQDLDQAHNLMVLEIFRNASHTSNCSLGVLHLLEFLFDGISCFHVVESIGEALPVPCTVDPCMD